MTDVEINERKQARIRIIENTDLHKLSSSEIDAIYAVIASEVETNTNKVLNKIRAEITENSIPNYEYRGCGIDLMIETSEVLQIIDKCRKSEWESK